MDPKPWPKLQTLDQLKANWKKTENKIDMYQLVKEWLSSEKVPHYHDQHCEFVMYLNFVLMLLFKIISNVCIAVGLNVDIIVGTPVDALGSCVGFKLGIVIGFIVAILIGIILGLVVFAVAFTVGITVGFKDGVSLVNLLGYGLAWSLVSDLVGKMVWLMLVILLNYISLNVKLT